jgi:aminoglycoside 6'-N-acetyltransferase I
MEPIFQRITTGYPYGLLLHADETRQAINTYLFDSEVYIAKLPETEEIVGVVCLLSIDANVLELKNIAISEMYRGKGLGSSLIEEAVRIAASKGYGEIIVGTGTADCAAAQIRFYERNGFSKFGIRENFFIENYPEPIYENGVRLKDMLMLKRQL